MLDNVRQRIAQVLVFSQPEAVPLHDDGFAVERFGIILFDQLAALGRFQHITHERVTGAMQAILNERPVQFLGIFHKNRDNPVQKPLLFLTKLSRVVCLRNLNLANL
jgi:cyclopropane fatty-acyl-phospholipid synthase-like methyltransferase